MQLYSQTQEEVRQAKFSNENRCNEGKAESSTGAMQWSGQAADREDIKRQAGSKRQAANSQKRVVQVINDRYKQGKSLRQIGSGKTILSSERGEVQGFCRVCDQSQLCISAMSDW